MGEWIFWYLYF